MKDYCNIMPLGAGREVGRSCFYVEYSRANVSGAFILDCGINPSISETNSKSDIPALPFFDLLREKKKIDFILISHFHTDHVSGLPAFVLSLQNKNEQVPIYMTDQTYSIMMDNFQDTIKQDKLFPQIRERSIRNAIAHQSINLITRWHRTISYHSFVKLANNLTVTAFAAGHVIGAAMFQIDINNYKVFYTGDYSMEPDKHLRKADIPENLQPDILITEGTYGSNYHKDRSEREKIFLEIIISTLKKSGKVLLPVFSVGRVQELIAILDEHWRQNVDLQQYKIYYVSSIGKKYKSATEHFISYEETDKFGQDAPCVVFCTPGMLQSGVSRRLFEEYCGSDKNTLLVTGYGAQGSLLHQIIQRNKNGNQTMQISTQRGGNVPLKMRVEEVSFSAHSDYQQTCQLLNIIKPKNVVFIHGSRGALRNLEDRLKEQIKNQSNPLVNEFKEKLEIFTPDNGETVKFLIENALVARLGANVDYKQFSGNMLNKNQLIMLKQDGVEVEVVEQLKNGVRVLLSPGIDVKMQCKYLALMLNVMFGNQFCKQEQNCQSFQIDTTDFQLLFRNVMENQTSQRYNFNNYRKLLYLQTNCGQNINKELDQVKDNIQLIKQVSGCKVEVFKNYNKKDVVISTDEIGSYMIVTFNQQIKEIGYMVMHRVQKVTQQMQDQIEIINIPELNNKLNIEVFCRLLNGKQIADLTCQVGQYFIIITEFGVVVNKKKTISSLEDAQETAEGDYLTLILKVQQILQLHSTSGEEMDRKVKTSFENQAENIYQYIEMNLKNEMDKEQELINKQDLRRRNLLTGFKNKMKKRLQLTQQSGQLITTTQQHISSTPIQDPNEIPNITKRAIRAGEFLPHCKHCTVSERHHTMCKIPTHLVKEAIAMREQWDNNPPLPQTQRFVVKNNKLDYQKRRCEALNHFKSIASVQEQQYEEEKKQRDVKKKNPTSLQEIVSKDPLRQEYITGLLTKQFTPDEMDQLIEQEKKDKLGASIIKNKQFTVSERDVLQLSYSGMPDDLDKTKIPTLQSSQQSYMNDTTESSKIMRASLPQMLKSAQLAQLIDTEGILNVELAPETQQAQKRKQVIFANQNQLLQKKYDAELSSDQQNINPDGFEEVSDRGFSSEAGTDNKARVDESVKQIAWFEKRHNIESQ